MLSPGLDTISLVELPNSCETVVNGGRQFKRDADNQICNGLKALRNLCILGSKPKLVDIKKH